MIRILIADPDSRTRQALALLFERKLDARCVGEARDLGSLEQQLAVSAPDLLLLDCYLPGLSAAERARLAGRLEGVRLVLMSVDADDVATAKALDAAFIYKGAMPDEVLAAFEPAAAARATHTCDTPMSAERGGQFR
jgi:DNA-binding NarL/FixJ family response regulator